MHIPALIFGLVAVSLAAARPMQVDDLFKVKRVADPQVSTTGDLAYQVGTVDAVANTITSRIWFKPAGKPAQELDLGPGSQGRPRFSPDGKRLAYEAQGQIWVLDLATRKTVQITDLSGGAEGHIWSPDGTQLAFISTTVW